MKKTNKLISILLVMVMLLSMAPLSLTASAASEAITLKMDSYTKVDYSNSATQYYQYNNYLYKAAYSNLKNISEVAICYSSTNYLRLNYTESDTGDIAWVFLKTSYRGSSAKLSNLPTAPGNSVDFYTSFEAIFVNEKNPVVTVTCMAVNEPVWSWSDSSATAAFTSTDGKATMTVTAAIESSEQTAATCLENDKTTYTATATANGKAYTNEKTVDGEQGPHSFEYSGDDVIGRCTNGCGYECPHENQTGESCVICGAVLHTHSFTYSASGDTITAVCANADGNCPDPEGTLTILAPADLYVDGTAKEATVENNLPDASAAVGYIIYSAPYGLPPKDAGTYTASVTVGGATATVEFTLLNYAAKVTDKDGNTVGTYKTFADAITAAQDNEGSTLTLLDNITLTSTQIIYSGKFTLDLNGKTLLNETGVTLQINKEANVTVKNSGEGGTIKTGGTNTPAISNLGTLTVDAGNIIGKKQAVNSSGTLTVNGGKFEAEYSLYISSGETVIEDGEFNGIVCVFASCTVNGGDFTAPRISINYEDGILTVNGGTFDIDEIRILAGTVSLAGGEFTNGFVLKSENTEDTLNSFLAEGYKFYDADGNKMTVADDATVINGYVKVKEHIVASVTVNNGGVEEVSYYKTFADAITAAQGSEGSTVTLLDDVTLTKQQVISSGKLTLDLNGKNLINENGRVLYINEEADLTIKDSGEGGTIETKYEHVDCIENFGKLTVESGIIKGDSGIRNYGVLYFKDGTVETDFYAAIINYSSGTVYVYDGVLKGGENSPAVDNNGTLYIYDGEIKGITNSNTAYISGGTIDRDDYAALNLLGGTAEVTGGSFTGTDYEYGDYSGTPFGEWTIDIDEGASLILKGGEFPNGFVFDETTANAFLAEDYYYKDADGKLIDVADDAKIINGYVKVSKGADLADAVITLDETQFTYSGMEHKPTVIVTIGSKTLTEGKDYTLTFANNVNAGTATVTVKGAGDYTGEATKEFTIVKADNTVTAAPTPNTLTYNGEAHNLISAGEAMYGTMVYSLDGAEYSETIPQGTNAGDYTVYYKVIGDANHNDTEPATVTVTINAKDISDGFIILGAPLTYNGKEQTQTVEKVIPTGTAPEATYTVSGNKATNVGVYLLTVTGTGNFTGEAKIAYEIAVDDDCISHLDRVEDNGVMKWNVKSTDRESLEYIVDQLNNAVTDIADADKKSEWADIKEACEDMLRIINSIELLFEAGSIFVLPAF